MIIYVKFHEGGIARKIDGKLYLKMFILGCRNLMVELVKEKQSDSLDEIFVEYRVPFGIETNSNYVSIYSVMTELKKKRESENKVQAFGKTCITLGVNF